MAKIEIELPGGAKAGKTLQELQKEASKLNKEISKLPVGSKEFVDKSKELQGVSSQLTDVRNQIKGTTTASNELKDSWTKFIPFGDQFAAIGDKLGGAKKGVGGLISSMTTLKGAIISTGIGALVILLGTLINYLTTTQEGMDKVSAVLRPLSAVFERFKGVLQELGGKVFKTLEDAIKNPIQAFKDLGQVILDNVINRFKAFALIGPAIKKVFSGDITGGLKDLGNAALQAVTGVENVIDKVVDAGKAIGKIVDEAWAKGKRLDDLQKSIEKQEISQITRLKALELALKQQKDIVEDTTKSWDERRAAAEKALTIQQTMLNEELSLLDKRIEKMKIEQSLNDTSREQSKELAELEAKKLELQAKTVEQGIEFKKKITEINTAQAAAELAIVQNLEDLKVEAMKEGMDKEIAQIELDTERKIEALTGSAEQIAEQKALLEQIELQAIQAVRDKYAEEAAAKDKADKDEKAKRDEEAKKKELELLQKTIDQKKAAEEAWTALQGDFFAMGAELLGQDEAARKKNATAIKAFTVGKIAVDLSREIQAIWANVAQYGPFGTAIGAAQTAFAVVRSALAARKVASQKFSLGGLITGPSHAQGGVPFSVNGRSGFEAEGGEVIMTKGVYRNPVLREAASRINVLGGGRKFASGGPVNPVATSTAAAQSNALLNMSETNDLLKQQNSLLVDTVQAMNARFDRLKVYNVATETQQVNDSVKKIQNEADV